MTKLNKSLHISFTLEGFKKIQKEAKKSGLTMSAFMREAIFRDIKRAQNGKSVLNGTIDEGRMKELISAQMKTNSMIEDLMNDAKDKSREIKALTNMLEGQDPNYFKKGKITLEEQEVIIKNYMFDNDATGKKNAINIGKISKETGIDSIRTMKILQTNGFKIHAGGYYIEQ